ncbi:MAG TPA: hypothetical protein VFF49_03090, partial [Thermodesulfobacteriota bacterium]|nr:hypothetical protein [Thermodesulfobacteriota bacterium]
GTYYPRWSNHKATMVLSPSRSIKSVTYKVTSPFDITQGRLARDRLPARLIGYPRKLNGRLKPSSTICSRNHPSTFSGQVRFPS